MKHRPSLSIAGGGAFLVIRRVCVVGPAWGWTHVDAIVTTLNALGILAGALIGASAIKQRLDRAA